MFVTTKGLILKEVRYKEADKILTILTEDEGKVVAKARGAVRPKSKLAGATQYLEYSEFTMFKHKDMWTVNEAVTVEPFLGLRQDIKKLALATYISDILFAVSDMDTNDISLLKLGLNALYLLSEDKCPEELIKAVFEFKMLCLSGYAPQLSVCYDCGEAISGDSFMDILEGELYCPNCAKNKPLHSLDVTEALRYVMTAEAQKIFSFTMSEEAMKEFSDLCERFCMIQLDRPFESLNYYKKL